MAKRKDTLKDYREGLVGSRLEKIQAALARFSHARYSNITGLARDVAGYVTILEAGDDERKPNGERAKKLRPVSHVTILRNEEYRALLNSFLSIEQEAGIPRERVDQALLLENEALKSKLRLFQNKLVDAYADWDLVDGRSFVNPQETKIYEWLRTALSVMDNMHKFSPGSFDFVTDPKGKRGMQPGLQAPMGLAATLEEMAEIEHARGALKEYLLKASGAKVSK